MNAITRTPADDDGDDVDTILRPLGETVPESAAVGPAPEPVTAELSEAAPADAAPADAAPAEAAPAPAAPAVPPVAPGAGPAASPAPGPGSAAFPGPPRPRIRWAGILWGLVFAAVAVAGIALATVPAFGDALDSLVFADLTSLVLTAVLVLGALLLLAGVSGMLARRSRRTS